MSIVLHKSTPEAALTIGCEGVPSMGTLSGGHPSSSHFCICFLRSFKRFLVVVL